MDSKSWQLRDVAVSAKGAKSCALVKSPNEKVFLKLGSKQEPLRTPFGATSFNDEAATRKTLEFSLSPEQVEQWNLFDAWALEYLQKHSERLFKKKLSAAEVKAAYKSPVTQKADYRPHLRCKINTGGIAAARIWDDDDNRTVLPDDLREFDIIPRIHISHLWIMGAAKDFGWVLQVNDLCVKTQPQVSPFAESEE